MLRKSGGDVASGCDLVFQVLLQATTVSKLQISTFFISYTFPREGILAMAKKVTISYSLSKCLTFNLLFMKLKCKL